MVSQRKLVTLRTITNIRRMKAWRYTIYDVVTLGGGWTVVVRHGAYDVGQNVFFFEIDSFIPAATRIFEWEENRYMTEYHGQKGFHVRSLMINKQLSQGMVKSIDDVPVLKEVLDRLEKDHGVAKAKEIARTMSFEDRLGVKKWEVAFEVQGKILGHAPRFFPRPACERVQNTSDVFSKNRDTVFQITEKLDGVSMTVYRVATGSKWDMALPELPLASTQRTGGARVGVSSAGQDLDQRANNVYWQAAKRRGLPDKLRQMNIRNVAIQGELIGPSIKNNSLRFPKDAEHDFIIFQIFDIDKQQYINAGEVVDMCVQLELPHVPVIGYMKLREFAASVQEILQKAEGVGSYGQTKEGFVFKSMRGDFAFKAISNQWLLEQGE